MPEVRDVSILKMTVTGTERCRETVGSCQIKVSDFSLALSKARTVPFPLRIWNRKS